MTHSVPKNPLKHLRASDLIGIAKLATDATHHATFIAEGVHQSVRGTLGLSSGKTRTETGGLTGLIYQSIRGVGKLVGKSVDSALAALQPLFMSIEQDAPNSPQREAVLAALNGVMGDYLAESNNSLATSMTIRYQGKDITPEMLPLPADREHGREDQQKILLMIHGLCMNDLQWQTMQNGQSFNHGEVVSKALDDLPIYLRYNTGKHISQNGRELAAKLEHWVTSQPHSIAELTVIAHSMGGLLIRSAVAYATVEKMRWPARLKSIVFLGTPHHGAPLERAGHWLDNILGSNTYSAPFARLAQLRSAGITDLRLGDVLDEHWQNDRHPEGKAEGKGKGKRTGPRQSVPLPTGVACFTIAATSAANRHMLADHLIGDGLVPLRSALGEHTDPQYRLMFAETSQWIAYETNHLALLSSPDVARQMINWLEK